MVKIYGYFKKFGFVIGDDLRKNLLGYYPKEKAIEILNDPDFIKRWNNNHTSELVKISIEIEDSEQWKKPTLYLIII